MDSLGNEDLPSSPPKKRKLKHPRTARACIFCRRRKVRCTGTQPCDYCHGESVRCEYADGIPRPGRLEGQARAGLLSQDSQSQARAGLPSKFQDAGSSGLVATSNDTPWGDDAVSAESPYARDKGLQSHVKYGVSRRQSHSKPDGSRRVSLEPPQTFAEGQHIGPSAGVSFLYHGWTRGTTTAEEETCLPAAPLTCHGDIPQAPVDKNQPLPTTEEARALIERYFQFATPTYRFLHRPTVEEWMARLLQGGRLSTSEAACVLIVFSQALLYTTVGDRYQDGGDEGLNRSRAYFDRAKSLLNQEPGPGTVFSVQARLAMCLYLLSTFRINECRFCFSLACTILTSIGLHRKTSPSHQKLGLVASEARKRTFWCAYVLDDYLSVMLGRPRILHDGDIDQEYPRNIDDHDLMSSESPEDLPLHGNLEAFIAHADLAKLMGRNSQLLYPLQTLTEDEVFVRTDQMLRALDVWRDALPDFLKPRDKTLAGQRNFERQNTVLKLAYAHLRILITRRCLLADFSRLGRSAPSPKDNRALQPIQDCMGAVCTILNAILDLNDKGTLYQGFWFTPYIAVVAISTLYVFIIQNSRAGLPEGLFVDVDVYFDKAKLCQSILSALSPEGSQARRHHRLLDRLRDRAEKDAARAGGRSGLAGGPPVQTFDPGYVHASKSGLSREQNEIPTADVGGMVADRPAILNGHEATSAGDDPADVLVGQFTPSEDDYMFQSLLSWGWESLDTVGFPGHTDGFNLQP